MNSGMAHQKKETPTYFQIDDEDLIAAGILTRVPAKQKAAAGPPEQKKEKNEFTYFKIDPKEIEEMQLPPFDIRNIYRPPNGTQKQRNSSNSQRRSSTLLSIRKPVSRTSTGQKDIAKKCVNNIKVSLTKENRPIRNVFNSMGYNTECVDKSNIRKKLFSMSSSNNAKSTENRTEGNLLKVPKKYNSPLMDLKTAEKLMKKSSSLQSLGIPKSTPLRLSTVAEESLTPSDKGSTCNYDSDRDFEIMENLCEEKNERICEILAIIKSVEEGSQKMEEKFEKFKEEFVAFKTENTKKLTELSSLIKKLASGDGTANDGKSSKKSIKKPKTPKRTPMKDLTQSNNLRKNVLLKGLGQVKVETPKLVKAEKMYNSLRNTYDFLVTPKTNKSSSTGTSISSKLKEQCLMLVDNSEQN